MCDSRASHTDQSSVNIASSSTGGDASDNESTAEFESTPRLKDVAISDYNNVKNRSVKSKSITLDLLIKDNVLEPGEKVLSVKYLGRILTADLLKNGKIKSNDTGAVFNTPSSWAIYCKKSINPAKTSGCGWGSIRYKGQSLDYFKSQWMSDGTPSLSVPSQTKPVRTSQPRPVKQRSLLTISSFKPKVVIVHSNGPSMTQIPLSEYDKHAATQVRCEGVDLSIKVIFEPKAIEIMAVQSFSSSDEVTGYLAGRYNSSSHTLTIGEVYEKSDPAARQKVLSSGLNLAGWFHSHPQKSFNPSVYDIECQLTYQLQMQDQPIVACIVGRKDSENKSDAYSILCYTVCPPKLKFSERFGCLADKCGKPRSVEWSLSETRSDSASRSPLVNDQMLGFLRNIGYLVS